MRAAVQRPTRTDDCAGWQAYWTAHGMAWHGMAWHAMPWRTEPEIDEEPLREGLYRPHTERALRGFGCWEGRFT